MHRTPGTGRDMGADVTRQQSPSLLYVWDGHYPWDVRTGKVCQSLTAAGYRVHIIARNRGAEPATEQLPEGLVHRMPVLPGLPARLTAALGFPAFMNPIWLALLARTIRQTDPEVVIVRDLPLCPTAIWAARRARLPVILDMAENYPAMIRAVWNAGRQRPWDCLVRNPAVVRLVEAWCLPRVDHLWVVVEESESRVLSLGVTPNRVSIVSNTPPRSRVAPARPAVPVPDRGGTVPLRLVYLGLMEIPRGVSELLRATAMLLRHGLALQLDLVGDGRDLEHFRREASELGLDRGAAVFHGYLDNAEALVLVAQADIGVVPHHADEAWNTTIPNKLFDYMAAGLPVVSSDAIPSARIVNETGAGVVFHSRDCASLAAAIRELTDPIRRAACSAAGRHAIVNRYNWEASVATMLKDLASLTAEQ